MTVLRMQGSASAFLPLILLRQFRRRAKRIAERNVAMDGGRAIGEAVELNGASARRRTIQSAVSSPLNAVGTVPDITERFDRGPLRIQCLQRDHYRQEVEHRLGSNSRNGRRAHMVNLQD